MNIFMITIHFEFENREATDLQQLNALLATMEMGDLELEDMQDYLAIIKDGDGNLVGKRYGVDSGTLVCKQPNTGNGYCFQIDSIVADPSVDSDTLMDGWQEGHPDRILCTYMTIGFEDAIAYLLLHHQKV